MRLKWRTVDGMGEIWEFSWKDCRTGIRLEGGGMRRDNFKGFLPENLLSEKLNWNVLISLVNKVFIPLNRWLRHFPILHPPFRSLLVQAPGPIYLVPRLFKPMMMMSSTMGLGKLSVSQSVRSHHHLFYSSRPDVCLQKPSSSFSLKHHQSLFIELFWQGIQPSDWIPYYPLGHFIIAMIWWGPLPPANGPTNRPTTRGSGTFAG